MECDGTQVGEERLPGRLGRLAFAYLAAEHPRAVPRVELASALWGDTPPPTWEKGISVVVSKLRTALAGTEIDRGALLANAFGCYQLRLPEGTWLDVAEAARSVGDAEAALAGGSAVDAVAPARLAAGIARQDFLPGEDGDWVIAKRRDLDQVLTRALDCLGAAQLQLGDARGAVQSATELIALEPYRESAYVLLMRAHIAVGDRGEAIRVYERCRCVLSEELGVDPHPDTQAVHLEILRARLAEAPSTPPSESPVPPAPTGEGSEPEPQPEPDPERCPRPPPRPQLASPSARLAPRSRLRIEMGALLALLLVLAAAITARVGVARDHSGGAATVPGPDTVAHIAPGRAVFDAVASVGASPSGIVVAAGMVWVVNYHSQTLSRVDPSTGQVVDTRAVGGAPTGIAFGAGSIWVTAGFGLGNGSGGAVLRFDTTTGQPARPIPVADGVDGIAYGGGSMWVADPLEGSVLSLDALDGRLVATLPVGPQPRYLAVGGTSLWVADGLDATLTRIDMRTGRVGAVIAIPSPTGLAADADSVWVVSAARNSVTHIDAHSGTTLSTIEVGAGPTGVAIAGTDVWVAAAQAGEVVRIDPSVNKVVATIPVQGRPEVIGSFEGSTWVAVQAR